jgi:ribose 1,5-bisphosphate isomerase
LEYKSVVTSFLIKDTKLLLLRRSDKVGTHKGKWAGVSGYLEQGEEAPQRAQIEIKEELGLSLEQINLLRVGETLRALDEQTQTVWIVHPFLFEARTAAIRLDWETREYKWIDPKELFSFETVPKLKETYDRVNCNLQATPTPLLDVFGAIERFAQDRVHGASALAHQALGILSSANEASQATDIDELFCDLLVVASRLRSAQQAMASVENLIGLLLFQVNLKRRSALNVADFKNLIRTLAKEISERSKNAAEDAARNSLAIIPESSRVLTHSYSSAVLRALELSKKGGRTFQVYATESYPGMEGKELAKALVNFGVPTKLIADSAIGSIISDVNLVLVGADSVLKDGSLLHKVGTRSIAAEANKRGIPVYGVCEAMKFSAADLLGEPLRYSETLFDITPGEHVSKFITELGLVEPREVEGQIRLMLKEMYP